MANLKNVEYQCKKCNSIFSKWTGRCSSCGEWNSLEEIEKINNKIGKKSGTISGTSSSLIGVSKKEARKLKDVENVETDRFLTNITEFDRTVGGGLVRDSISILSAPPGAGKSTICLQVANAFVQKGLVALYCSGEESAIQIKRRAERLQLPFRDEIVILDSASMNDVLSAINKYNPDFCVIDSIQTYSLKEFLPARAGNPIQVMECATEMVNVAKYRHKPCAIIMIGQTTKEDELAGIRSLEHLVDAYFKLDGDRDDSLRMLSPVKNRFGSTDEIGFFKMTSCGLETIDNPSEYFMIDRPNLVAGTAMTVLREGSRPVIIEIDALTSRTFSQYPMRIGDTIKKDKMNILVSILEQKADMTLFDTNIVVASAGGVKLQDNSCSLAILMAIVSSKKEFCINNKVAFLADVALTGELRKLPDAERSIKELNRMGFSEVYVANGQKIDENVKKELKIKIKKFHTVSDVIKEVFK